MYWTAVLAFLGLAAHAVIPLQADILDAVKGVEGVEVTSQSTFHQLSAAAFFLLSYYHGYQVLQILWGLGSESPISYQNNKAGFLVRFGFIFGVSSPFLSSPFIP